MEEKEVFNPVERIIELCRIKQIPVSRMEKDLGYGNGYLNPKKITDIKFTRLTEMLNYLGVSLAEFAPTIKKEPATDGDGVALNEMHEFINSLVDKLPFEKQIQLIDELRSQSRSQEGQDGRTESD